MSTAIVYVLTSLSLAIIIAIAQRKGARELDGEFRYQPVLLKVLLACSFTPIAAVAFIYVVARPRPLGVSLLLLIVGGCLGSALFLYAYRYLRSLVVSVSADGIIMSSIRGKRLIPFNSVKRAIYLSPSGQGGVLCLYDNNKKLIEFSESISGIEELAKLVESRSKGYGVIFETRKRRI